MSENCDIIVFFLIYGQLAAKWISDAWLFLLTITFYLTKTENRTKKSNTALILLLWVTVLFLPKNANFLPKNADTSKIKGVLVLKGTFSETTYACAEDNTGI